MVKTFYASAHAPIPPVNDRVATVDRATWALTCLGVLVKCPCGEMPEVYREPSRCACGRIYRATTQLTVDLPPTDQEVPAHV